MLVKDSEYLNVEWTNLWSFSFKLTNQDKLDLPMV